MVTKAVKSVDASANVARDLPSQTVSIETAADADRIKSAMDAGYFAEAA